MKNLQPTSSRCICHGLHVHFLRIFQLTVRIAVQNCSRHLTTAKNFVVVRMQYIIVFLSRILFYLLGTAMKMKKYNSNEISLDFSGLRSSLTNFRSPCKHCQLLLRFCSFVNWRLDLETGQCLSDVSGISSLFVAKKVLALFLFEPPYNMDEIVHDKNHFMRTTEIEIRKLMKVGHIENPDYRYLTMTFWKAKLRQKHLWQTWTKLLSLPS